MTVMQNDDATAGGIIGFVALFLVCAFLTAVLGSGIDAMVATHNALIGTYPVSQDAINTGQNLITGFKLMMFMLFLALGLNLLNNAQRESTGGA